MTDSGPPAGFSGSGDPTPFTRFTPKGDIAPPWYPNAVGDPVPYELTRFSADGSPAPFATNAQGDVLPGIYQLWPGLAPGGAPQRQAPAAHLAHAPPRTATAPAPARPAAALPLAVPGQPRWKPAPKATPPLLARLLLGLAGLVASVLFLIAPWFIMATTGLAHNSDAHGGGGALLEVICGIWGLGNIALLVAGLARLPDAAGWVFHGNGAP